MEHPIGQGGAKKFVFLEANNIGTTTVRNLTIMLIKTSKMTGHLSALVTILIWVTTFISTKLLLKEFSCEEILLYRFVLGLLALLIVCPHRFRIREKKQELTSLRQLGAVRTSVYIYMVPVITVIISILVLRETLTWISALGMALSLAVLFIPEHKRR